MADLNMCLFTGRLGKDPEQRIFSNGDVIANFSIAVGKKWRDKQSGEMREHTSWVRCVAHGKTAELIMQYAKKGSQIRVTSEFSERKWTDQASGQERSMVEMKVQDFQLLGGKPEGAGGGQQQAPAQRQQQRAPAAPPAQGAPAQGGFDDDIPF